MPQLTPTSVFFPQHPPPFVRMAFKRLRSKAGMMSMLIAFSTYNKVLVKEEDRPNTSFTTPWGTFEYLRMAF
jgi:hypothetical protein